MNKGKLLAVIGLAALIAAFFIFDLGKYFSLDYMGPAGCGSGVLRGESCAGHWRVLCRLCGGDGTVAVWCGDRVRLRVRCLGL